MSDNGISTLDRAEMLIFSRLAPIAMPASSAHIQTRFEFCLLFIPFAGTIAFHSVAWIGLAHHSISNHFNSSNVYNPRHVLCPESHPYFQHYIQNTKRQSQGWYAKKSC